MDHNIVVRNTESVIVKQYPVPFHTEKTKRKLENVPIPALSSVCFVFVLYKKLKKLNL